VVTVEKKTSTISTLPRMHVPAYEFVALKTTWITGYSLASSPMICCKSVIQKLQAGVSRGFELEAKFCSPEGDEHGNAEDAVSNCRPHHGSWQL